MGGLLAAGVLLAALVAACDTKSPVGPGAVTPPSTTTSIVGVAPAGVAVLTAAFTISPNVVTVGQQVTVNGSGSAAPAGRSIVAFDWDFGNGVTKSGATTTNSYAAAGAFPIVLTVSDNTGQ